MSKITYTHLRDICNVNQGLQISIDKRFKEAKENRYFYITVQFLKDSYLEKYYVENPTKSTICEEDDILVVRTGNTGQIITGIKGCFHNNFFKVNFDKNKLNSKFLYYCLTTKEKQYEMSKRAGITTIPDLNHFMFLDMQIPLQSKENQDSIVKILDSINSKIELNNRINKELESMAKTLYDYWFVQFDFPDENGKPYKSSGGKIFYNKELKREIPKGWEVKTLNELLINCSDSISNSNISEKDKYTPIDYLPMKKMSFGSYLDSKEAKTSLIKYKEYDILIGAMRVYFHRVCIAPFNGITRTTCLVLRAKNQNHLPYLFQLCNEDRTINIANKLSTGSQQPYVNWENNLEKYKVSFPNDINLVNNYSKKIDKLIKKVILNEKENQKLSELRDWLLPMLMNGQVRVK